MRRKQNNSEAAGTIGQLHIPKKIKKMKRKGKIVVPNYLGKNSQMKVIKAPKVKKTAAQVTKNLDKVLKGLEKLKLIGLSHKGSKAVILSQKYYDELIEYKEQLENALEAMDDFVEGKTMSLEKAMRKILNQPVRKNRKAKKKR